MSGMVSLFNLGCTCIFAICASDRCQRFLAQYEGRDWRTCDCEWCCEVVLRSGSVLAFPSDVRFGVVHGVLGTLPHLEGGDATARGLTSHLRTMRLSVQSRTTRQPDGNVRDRIREHVAPAIQGPARDGQIRWE